MARLLRSQPAKWKLRKPPFISAGALTPGVISFVSKTNTTVTLAATDATGITSPYTYQWYRSTSSGFTPGAGNILSTETSLALSDSGLSSNTTYYYVLRYTDSVAQTADATQLGVTTDFSGSSGGSIFGSSIIQAA